MRFKRTQIQMQYAMMMNPPEQEEATMPEPEAKPKTKKRTLKKHEA